jgi:hypothetical protein
VDFQLMDLDGDGFTELCEPDSGGALRALRFVEDTYGTDHPLTKNAHKELVRIQASEEAKAQDVPIHISMGRLALCLSNLDNKLCQQADFMQQARDEYEKAEERIADLAATTADIEAEIRTTEQERDNLIARSIPVVKGTEVQELSLEELTKFLEGAIGVVDSAVIHRIQDELATIALKVHEGQAASTASSDFDQEETGATPATPTTCVPTPLATDPQGLTHQGLAAAYELTTQALLQAKATNALSKQALTTSTCRTTDSNAGGENNPPATRLQEASATASAAHLAEQEADRANEVAKEALSLFKQHQQDNKGPYGGK